MTSNRELFHELTDLVVAGHELQDELYRGALQRMADAEAAPGPFAPEHTTLLAREHRQVVAGMVAAGRKAIDTALSVVALYPPGPT